MKLSNVVFEMCRHYVADSAPTLGAALTSQIEGYIRSRSVSSLTVVSRCFDPAQHGHRVLKTLLQIEAFFKKCDVFSNKDCEDVARSAFLESEEVCRMTNERLESFYEPNQDDWVRERVELMQSTIAETLGPYRNFLDELPRLVRSTNGATSAHPRKNSGFVDRLKRTMYATERSRPYLHALSEFWGFTYNFRAMHHNRVEFVPKNWKTHRAIACEPEGNLALQLAFDSFCKVQLRRKMRIDLRDQSRNQRLALQGSVDGALCTVDLKAASDRLARAVVPLLFPEDWARFFSDTRSPLWKAWDGRLRPYHKLSSMGNGYTFSIETLVFAACCKAIGSRKFSVYGDDIIVETELYGDLVAMLQYLGFEVNEEKSHASLPHVPNNWLSVIQTRGEALLSRASTSLEVETKDNVGFQTTLTGEDKRASGSEWAAWLSGAIASPDAPGSTYGVYRESCGVHAFGGEIITPLFLTSLRTRRDWNLLMNNIMSFGEPGGHLWKWAAGIIRSRNLHFGPPVWDRGAYVFIDVQSSYQLGLIREHRLFGPWQPAVRISAMRSTKRVCRDWRALFLWYLHRRSVPLESSRHTLGLTRVVSKWVRYRPLPVDLMGEPGRLYRWSEVVTER